MNSTEAYEENVIKWGLTFDVVRGPGRLPAEVFPRSTGSDRLRLPARVHHAHRQMSLAPRLETKRKP